MKTNHQITTKAIGFALLLAATALALPQTARAQQKGAEKLVKLNRITTPADIQSVEPGDTMVMACPKCKDVWVRVVEPTFKAASPTETHLVPEHQCPGCSSKRISQGHGKAKATRIVHVCTHCGNTDMTCSVMKKDSGTHQH